MKRRIPNTLTTFWQNNPNCLRADIFSLALPTGQLVFTTSGQWDLNIPSGTPGWSLNVVSSSTVLSHLISSPATSSYGFSSSGLPVYIEFACNPNSGICDIYLPASTGTGYFFRVDGRASYPIGQILAVSNLSGTGGTGWANIGTNYVASNAAADSNTHNVRCYVGNNGQMAIWVDGALCCSVVDTTYTPNGAIEYGYESGYSGPTIAPMVTTAYAVKYGAWKRGPTTSEAGFNLSANTMTLSCAAPLGVSYPNLNVGLLNAALNSLFDTTTVNVWTAYMPNTVAGAASGYGTVNAGVEPKWTGIISKRNALDRTHVEFECADPLMLLNLKVPTRIFQSNCPWSFGDSNCNPPGGISAYMFTFTSASGSTHNTLIPSTAFSQAAGYFSQGVVRCLKGATAGISGTVKSHDSSGNLEMTLPLLLAPNVGDTFVVTAGCDHTFPTCKTKFNNVANHGGMEFIPVPDKAI